MLKRQYPTRITFKRLDSSGFDVETGDRTRIYSSKVIRKAIFFPYTLDRKFVYDLAYIASNKNFTQGGFFGKREATIIVENSDLGGFVPSTKDIIEQGEQTWKIISIDTHPTNIATIFGVISLEGNDNE